MVTDRVRTFIVEDLGWQGPELTDDFPLLENLVIDSLGLFRVVGFLETEYGVQIPDDQLVPENFATLSSIASLIDQPS